MNKPERSSPPRTRGTGSPDCEGSPPIDSSTGNASPALAGDPGALDPLGLSAPSNDLDDEVGREVRSFIAGMTDHISRLHWISTNRMLTGIRLSEKIQRETGICVVLHC